MVKKILERFRKKKKQPNNCHDVTDRFVTTTSFSPSAPPPPFSFLFSLLLLMLLPFPLSLSKKFQKLFEKLLKKKRNQVLESDLEIVKNLVINVININLYKKNWTWYFTCLPYWLIIYIYMKFLTNFGAYKFCSWVSKKGRVANLVIFVECELI